MRQKDRGMDGERGGKDRREAEIKRGGLRYRETVKT